VFAIVGVTMVTVTDKPTPFPSTGIVSETDFGRSVEGWSFLANSDRDVLPNRFLTTCNGVSILGGYNQVGAGIAIQKSWSKLPASTTGLIFSINIFVVGSWDNELAKISVIDRDEIVVWSQRFQMTGAPLFSRCTGLGEDNQWHQIVTVEGHVNRPTRWGSSLTMRMATTLNEAASNEAFGLAGVYVKAVAHSVNPPNPGGTTHWKIGGAADFAVRLLQAVDSLSLPCTRTVDS